jgi:hypothetical protein
MLFLGLAQTLSGRSCFNLSVLSVGVGGAANKFQRAIWRQMRELS